jgi:membrane-bound inhibitor of C-type lysozyme
MVLSLTVAACAEKFTGKTYVYTCSDGTRIEVVYSKERNYARVRIGDATYELKQVPAASGTKYSGGKVVFWNKGRGALVQIGGEIVHEGCHLVE